MDHMLVLYLSVVWLTLLCGGYLFDDARTAILGVAKVANRDVGIQATKYDHTCEW